MIERLARLACVAFLVSPWTAGAEPITLKLAFFTSDRSTGYQAIAKPFLEAVNADPKGLLKIDLYSGGVLGRDVTRQPQLVLDGIADLAFVVPGYTPERFPENAVLELSGLFRNTREGTLVYTQLTSVAALRGYDDFVVIGAYVTEPETIHGRVTINSIDDLKGKRIRVNNSGETAALEKLGAKPVPMPVTQISNALSAGNIDAATMNRGPLADYGIQRIATHHYLLGTSGAPLALLMSRKKFESLPKAARDVIEQYAGKWAALRFIDVYDAADERVMSELASDPKRSVIRPSRADLDIANAVFKSSIEEWTTRSTNNRRLLGLVQDELTKLRAVR